MSEKKERKNRNRSNIVLGVQYIIWGIALILYIMYKDSEIMAQRLIPIVILGVWLAYEVAIGLVSSPKRLESLWIVLFASLFLFLEHRNEAINITLLFLLYKIVIQSFMYCLEPYGAKYHLSLKDFANDYESFIRYNNILTLPLSIIIGGIVFFLNKEILDLALYAIGLSLLALSLSFFPVFLMALSFIFMIRLARGGIYHQDSNNLKNKFYDKILMEDEGIITDGEYEIATILPITDYSEEEIIEILAYGFYNSTNPLRSVFIKKYGKKVLPTLISNFTEDERFGVSLQLAEDTYRIGKAPLLSQIGRHPQEPDTAQVIYYVLKNGEEIATIELISHMSENLTNSIEKLKSHYTSSLACFLGENQRLCKRVCNGYGLEILNMEDDEKRVEYFNSLKGKIIYIDGMDSKRQFDTTPYPITTLHIGEDLREDRDYDIWMPHGSLEMVCEMMDGAKEFVSLRNRFIAVYIILKIILVAFIISMSISPIYIMIAHIIILIFLKFVIIANKEKENE